MGGVISPALLGALWGLVAGAGALLVLRALTDDRQSRPPRVSRLRQLLVRAGLAGTRPATVVAACVACGLVAGLLTLVVSAVPVVAAISAAFAANVPVILLRRRARVRSRVVQAAWPEAVDCLVSAIRAGLSLPEALAELARVGPQPLREPFAQFAVDYRASASFAAALDRLQADLADPVADRVLASMRIAREVGGSDLNVVLRTLSSLLREDARTRGEIEGRQSWTVSAARLAVAAPWITLVLLCTRPEAIHAYRSATGAVVLLAAAVVSFAAYRVMMRIGRLPAEPRLSS